MNRKNNLPNALLIGGMKCGSSTLYDDLAQHPKIFDSPVKEPSFLKEPNWDTAQIASAYSQLYRNAGEGEFLIDGSTRYSMRNDVVNPAQRAAQILPENTKIIYIIREPVARIVSHFRHAVDASDMADNFSVALRQDRRLLDYTRYYHQLEIWLDAFGPENVFVVTLDTYLESPQAIFTQLLSFLGLPPARLTKSAKKNQAEDRVVLPKYFSKILRSLNSPRGRSIYQSPAMLQLRKAAKKILPSSKNRVAAFSPTMADKKYIWENLEKDLKQTAPLCQGEIKNLETIWDAPDY